MAKNANLLADSFPATLKSGKQVNFQGLQANGNLYSATIEYPNGSSVKFDRQLSKKNQPFEITGTGKFPSAETAARDLHELLKIPGLLKKVHYGLEAWGDFGTFQRKTAAFADEILKAAGAQANPHQPAARQQFRP